jgi:hypothetical protein
LLSNADDISSVFLRGWRNQTSRPARHYTPFVLHFLQLTLYFRPYINGGDR